MLSAWRQQESLKQNGDVKQVPIKFPIISPVSQRKAASDKWKEDSVLKSMYFPG